MLESFLVYKYGFPSNLRAMLAVRSAFPLTRAQTPRKPPMPVTASARALHRDRAHRAPILCGRHRSDRMRAAPRPPRAFA